MASAMHTHLWCSVTKAKQVCVQAALDQQKLGQHRLSHTPQCMSTHMSTSASDPLLLNGWLCLPMPSLSLATLLPSPLWLSEASPLPSCCCPVFLPFVLPTAACLVVTAFAYSSSSSLRLTCTKCTLKNVAPQYKPVMMRAILNWSCLFWEHDAYTFHGNQQMELKGSCLCTHPTKSSNICLNNAQVPIQKDRSLASIGPPLPCSSETTTFDNPILTPFFTLTLSPWGKACT